MFMAIPSFVVLWLSRREQPVIKDASMSAMQPNNAEVPVRDMDAPPGQTILLQMSAPLFLTGYYK